MAEVKKTTEIQGNNTVPETVPGNEPPKTVEPAKRNIFKRAWDGIKAGFEAVRKSPQAAAIGAVAGSLVTLGVGAYIEHKFGGGYIQGELPEPTEDQIEIEDTNDYMEGPADDDGDGE